MFQRDSGLQHGVVRIQVRYLRRGNKVVGVCQLMKQQRGHGVDDIAQGTLGFRPAEGVLSPGVVAVFGVAPQLRECQLTSKVGTKIRRPRSEERRVGQEWETE